jgi:hypothetical protein
MGQRLGPSPGADVRGVSPVHTGAHPAAKVGRAALTGRSSMRSAARAGRAVAPQTPARPRSGPTGTSCSPRRLRCTPPSRPRHAWRRREPTQRALVGSLAGSGRKAPGSVHASARGSLAAWCGAADGEGRIRGVGRGLDTSALHVVRQRFVPRRLLQVSTDGIARAAPPRYHAGLACARMRIACTRVKSVP